jgi:hypothetical protein
VLREAKHLRSRRIPCPRAAALALQGVLTALCRKHSENALRRSWRLRRVWGPSTRGRRAERDFRFAQDDRCWSGMTLIFSVFVVSFPKMSTYFYDERVRELG